MKGSKAALTLGGMFGIPLGAEEFGGEVMRYGVYAAARYRSESRITMTGNLGVEVAHNDELAAPGAVLGIGAVVNTSERLNLVGELRLGTSSESGVVLGGADYRISSVARLRGAAFVGVTQNEDAPRLGANGGVLIAFGH